MALTDDLKHDVDDRPPWQVCGVRWIVDEVAAPEDSAFLAEAIEDRRISASRIEAAVRRNIGKRLPLQTVLRHRRGECGCPR